MTQLQQMPLRGDALAFCPVHSPQGCRGSWGVSGGRCHVPTCRPRLPSSVTHSPSANSHTAAFPRDRGGVSEWRQPNGEPKSLSLGPG